MGRKRKEHKIINGVEMKHCWNCDTWLPLDDFHKGNTQWDGLHSFCKTCNCVLSKQWNINNREKHIERSIQWRINNPERYKNNKRKLKYGITTTDVDRLYLQQRGLCAICHQSLEYKEIVIEHSHEFNAVRGLTHQRCNVKISQFTDNVSLLQQAINYLIDDYKTSNNDRLVYINSPTTRKKYLILLLESQEYKCPICQRDLTPFDAVIEHNHNTNLIRSASCQRCNIGIALFHDSIEEIGQAIQYLITSEYNILIHGSVIDKNRKVS